MVSPIRLLVSPIRLSSLRRAFISVAFTVLFFIRQDNPTIAPGYSAHPPHSFHRRSVYQHAFPRSTNNISSYDDLLHQVDFSIPVPNNLNIVFMGDSLTRYQYLDLVYFLSHNGTWISNNDRPNMVLHNTHADWNTFYNFTNSILEPFENCDCFMNEGKTNHAIVTENRYFLDTERNNTVTYLQKFGYRPFKTSWHISEIHNKHELVTHQDNVSIIDSWDWVETVQNFVCNMTPRPSAFIWNSGLWDDSDLSQLDTQLQMTSSLRRCGIISVYKTTTVTKKRRLNTPDENRGRLCALAYLCLNVSWTGMVPSDLYWDNVHFVNPVYSMLNVNLLSLLAFYKEVKFFE